MKEKIVVVPAEEDRLIQKFLYGGHKDSFDFPDSSLFIGTGFEIGGTHETWGFGVFKKVNDKMITISEGRDILSAIEKAKKVFKCEHDYDKFNRCNKCNTHKNVIDLLK